MRATSLLRTAWLWLLDYAYVGRWQVQGLFSPADETVYLAPGAAGQPVVLLPGVYERWQFMRPVADLLQGLGHPVHVVARLRWNAAPLAASARLVADHLEQHDLRDVLVVAHSKGGLIGKSLMLDERAGPRIDRMIAIATPFSGSVYAQLFLIPAVRALSPRDRTLRSLGEQLEVNSRITSIWGAFDPHIPGGSRLEGATNVRLRTSGHFRVLGQAELLDAVARAAARPVGR